VITDHPYRSCYFARSEAELNSALAIFGLCVCPYGVNRCHKGGCGERREAHVVCCEGRDVACPVHGTEVGRRIASW
jgi:hypothetical protein